MAKGFNLTAQINLRGPNNLKPIVAEIKRELGTVQANVSVKLDNRSAKSVDDITRRLSAMNSVLVQSKQHANDLKNTFRDLSAALGNFQSTNQSASRTVQQVGQNFQSTSKNIQVARTEMEEFGRQTFLAVKRFAAFSLPTTGIFAFVNAINNGINAFINFDKELIKLQQVTGKGVVGISGLEQEITRLATSLGVSSESLLTVASTLAQAGLSAEETRIALAALAKTELAPSFDDLKSTTEGAIAALRQFSLGAGDLEAALGSINAVAAAFAVESSDIITAIQRTGGVFASASKGVSQGKDALNEFIAVFTSVRATTRESAETIATGLRTIFTRIQRAGTIKQLKEFGVNLQDLEGKFVGPFEAVKRLSAALSQLDPRDVRFSTIVEELGGFRQIGKVIPLIQQFATAQQALGVAQKGAGSLTEAQRKAQESLANQIAKVREQFLALIRDIGKSSVFKGLFTIVTGLTSGLISLAGAFKPILPLLGIFAAVKGVKAISEIGSGFFGGMRKGGGAKAVGTNIGETLSGAKEKEASDVKNRATTAITENTTALKTLTTAVNALTSAMGSRPPGTLSEGGRILRFQTGGVVPGSGRGDKVHAMLEPGEVVMSNQAAQKYGRGNLVRMNRYAKGGIAKAIVNRVVDGDTLNINVTPSTDPFDTSATRLFGFDAYELNKGTDKERKLGEKAKKLAETYYPKGKDVTPLFTQEFLKNTKRDKYGRYFYSDDSFGKTLVSKGLGIEYSGSGPRATKKYALGGLVQKFMAGSVGGAKKKGIDWESLNKGRGSKESRGARPIAEPISTETYLKWAKDIYAEYDADPSLVRTASGLPPEIDLANMLLAQIAFETSGAGLRVGQRFVRTPKNLITDELKPYLIPDPSDPSELGFYEDIVAKFLRPKQMSKAATAKLGKDYALKAATARLSSYTDAESAISEFKKSGVLNIDPDIMSYIISSISNLDSLPLPKNEIASLRSKLTPTNLEAFKALTGPKKTPVEVQGQRTKLSEVFNAILETYGSDISDLEVDNIIRGLGQSISKKEAKQLSLGGLVQNFMAGGAAQPGQLALGPYPKGKKSKTGQTWKEILAGIASQRKIGFNGTDFIISGKKIPLSKALSPTQLKAGTIVGRTLDDDKTSIGILEAIRGEIVKAYEAGALEVSEVDPFNLTSDEKAAAKPIAIAGIRTNLTDLKPYYRKRNNVPLHVYTGIIKGEDYKDVEKLWQNYYEAQMKAVSSIAGRRGMTARDVSEEERKTLGLANAQGYDLEMILAALGSVGGKRTAQDAIDFAQGLSPLAASVFGVPTGIPTQAKLTLSSDNILDGIDGIIRTFAFGGKADGPGFEEIRQQIIDKYPDINFGIRKRKGGFGYNLMGALKSAGPLYQAKGLKFEQPSNLKKLSEAADKMAGDLMQPKAFVGGGSPKDTVAAMVSNKEGFVPPALAKKIGYAKLDRMNQADKNGMGGYAGGGGIGIFEGPGSGTSDSIGPIKLPVGSYILRERATEALGLSTGFSRGGGVGIKKFAKGTAVTKIERLKAEAGSERAKKAQLEQQRASATGIDAEILQNAINQSAEKIRKLEASIEDTISGFDQSTQDMENKDKALSDATQQLINKVKERYEKTSGKKWEDLTVGQQAADIKKARAGGYKDTAGVDPFEMENKAVDKAEKAAKRRRARRQKGYGDLKSTADIREATLTPKEIKQRKEADKAMFRYRADQAGTSEASVKLDLARKLGRATYESQSLFGGKVSEAQTGLVTRRESSMKIKQTIDKARSQLEAASKGSAEAAAAAQQLADAQSRLAAESEAVLQQMIELRPDLAGTEEGMKQLKDASTQVAEDLSEGNLGEAQKKLQAAVAGSGAAGALSDTEAAAIARARVSRETGFSSQLLERQFGSGGPDAAMARRQVFAQSREGQRFGPLAEFIPGLEGFSKTRIGKGLGGAADFISGKGGKASQLFARAGGIQGIGAGVAVGAEALKQYMPVGSLRNPNVAGAFGAISGAGAMGAGGAQLGMMIAGPVGALIGGIGGAIIGGIKGWFDGQNAARLTNALDKLTDSTGKLDQAFQKIDSQFNEGNFEQVQRAIGEQIQNQATVQDIAMANPSFFGYNNQQITEAGTASSAAAGAITKNLTRLAEIRASKTSLADLEKSRTDVRAGRAENSILAQARLIARQQGKDENAAVRQAAVNARVAQLKEQGTDPAEIVRRLREEYEQLVTEGIEVTRVIDDINTKNQILSRVMHDVARATESMMEAISALQGRIQRFGDEIGDILTESENISNPNELRKMKRTGAERILSNTAGYSREQVEGAIDDVVQKMGGGIEAVSLGKQVKAGEDLKRVLPTLLRQPGAASDFDTVRNQATAILENAGATPELIKSITNELGKKFEAAKTDGGQGLGLLADEIEKVGLSGFSKVLDAARDALVDFDRKVSDAYDGLTKVQNQWVDAMMRSIDYSNRATQIRLQGELELKKALGQDVSLKEMNEPFKQQVVNLAGTTDPTAISETIKNRQNIIRKFEAERANLALQPNSKERESNLKYYDESIRRHKLDLDKANKALQMLAEDGTTAANALQKLAENQGRAKTFSNTIGDIVFDAQKRMDMVPKLAAFISGQKALKQNDNSLFGNEVFGKQYLGGIDILGQLGVKEQTLTQLRNQATIEGLKAQGQGQLLQLEIPGAEKLFGEGNNTIEKILNLASNPENDPLVKAAKDAFEAQKEALDKMASAAKDIANNIKLGGIKPLIEKLATELPDIIKSAYDQAKSNIEQATKAANATVGFAAQSNQRGGLIYASQGRLIDFKSKGTDTIPAMLTKGEYVVNRESTSKNLPLLEAINNGASVGYSKGGVVYLAKGGKARLEAINNGASVGYSKGGVVYLAAELWLDDLRRGRNSISVEAADRESAANDLAALDTPEGLEAARRGAYKAQQEARRQQYLARNPAAAKTEARKQERKLEEEKRAYDYLSSKYGMPQETIDRMKKEQGDENVRRRALKEYRLFRQRKFAYGTEVANKLENAGSKEEKDKILAEAGVKTATKPVVQPPEFDLGLETGITPEQRAQLEAEKPEKLKLGKQLATTGIEGAPADEETKAPAIPAIPGLGWRLLDDGQEVYDNQNYAQIMAEYTPSEREAIETYQENERDIQRRKGLAAAEVRAKERAAQNAQMAARRQESQAKIDAATARAATAAAEAADSRVNYDKYKREQEAKDAAQMQKWKEQSDARAKADSEAKSRQEVSATQIKQRAAEQKEQENQAASARLSDYEKKERAKDPEKYAIIDHYNKLIKNEKDPIKKGEIQTKLSRALRELEKNPIGKQHWADRIAENKKLRGNLPGQPAPDIRETIGLKLGLINPRPNPVDFDNPESIPDEARWAMGMYTDANDFLNAQKHRAAIDAMEKEKNAKQATAEQKQLAEDTNPNNYNGIVGAWKYGADNLALGIYSAFGNPGAYGDPSGVGDSRESDRLRRRLDTGEANRRKRLLRANPYALGGIVYASGGGFLPRGTDTIPAMLSKGEFVVNSNATSNNLPLLQHLNKGGMVRYYREGSSGPVPSSGSALSSNNQSSTAYKIDSTGLDSFLTSFGSYVDKLTKITFPTIPDTITMNGNHVVDVRVSGAAAFEAINDNVKNMINTAIDEKMGEIWRQSNGQLGSRPVSATAGGSKSTSGAMQ